MSNQSRAQADIGQTKSHCGPRRAYKLSKPRTNTSTTNLVILNDRSEETASSPDKAPTVVATDVMVNLSKGDSRGYAETRHKLRAHIFGNGTPLSRKSSSEDDSEDRNGFVEAARGVKDRISRTGSIYSQLPGGRTSAREPSNSHMPLVQESTTMNHEETSQVVEDIKQKALHDRLAALNHVSTPVDEDMHVDSVLSPIRRRSLLTPGIATRIPDDILRKPPLPERTRTEDDRDYFFNSTLPQSSTPSRLVALDLANQGRFSPVPRAATPLNLDYTHLGGLKLGTLRITNGADPPAPRDQFLSPNRQSSPDLKCHEGYFPASEGKSSDNKDVKPASQGINRRSGELVDSFVTTSPADRPSAEIGRVGTPYKLGALGGQRSGSPLKLGCYQSNPSSEDESIQTPPIRSLSKERRSLSLSACSPTSPTRAASMAQAYMSELADSPFASTNLSLSNGPKFENGWGDKLFKDEDMAKSALQFPSIDKWKLFIEEAETRHCGDGSREDAFRVLNGMTSCFASERGKESQRTSLSSGRDSISRSNAETEASGSPPTEADSGYSSNVSLRSLRKREPTLQIVDPSFRPAIKMLTVFSRSPSGPREKPASASSSNSEHIVKLPTSTLVRPSILTVPKATVDNPYSNSSAQNSSQTVTTLGSSSSSTSHNSSEQGKIKKQTLESPAWSITIQGHQDLSNSNVPPVPSEMAARHAERVRNFPLLEHTFASMHHTGISIGTTSPEPIFVPIRFPSPAHNDEEEYAPTTSSKSALPPQQSDAKFYSHPRRKFSFVSTSKTERRLSRRQLYTECDVGATIADFGSVTESLGKSPYDVASMALATKPRLSTNPNSSHAYQMCTATQHTRSTVGMDDETATELSRVRNKTRTQSLTRPRTSSFNDRGGIPGRMPRPRSLRMDVPPVPSLPIAPLHPSSNLGIGASAKSHRRKSLEIDATPVLPLPNSSFFNDRGGIPGKLPRPRSMFVDAPPMPALPTAQEILLKEAQISKSNSQRASFMMPLRKAGKCSEPAEGDVTKTPAVEEEHDKGIGLQDGWEAFRQAWSQRRKSAGDGLLNRAQTTTDCLTTTSLMKSDPQSEALHTRSIGLNVSKQAPKSFHIPLTPPQSQPTSHNSSTTSLQNLKPFGNHVAAADASSFERLAGRYEGGLYYGYEPGFGLGGSAGTRSIKTGASRKSVDVSLGYGIDLSDIPIFVAPSQ
ncbi:hypothetical protein MMC24_000874 [Lignoscripta atroalba]|nr:hypothetical protein [Lignoscripta atroalba]